MPEGKRRLTRKAERLLREVLGERFTFEKSEHDVRRFTNALQMLCCPDRVGVRRQGSTNLLHAHLNTSELTSVVTGSMDRTQLVAGAYAKSHLAGPYSTAHGPDARDP
jgi:hypothetical protein